ncbi:hypothetical protein ABTZ78_17515 [Streptomyces bauhiniae]|uniref:hypothetical protein n=1 Tax=Streptomyces bauhiniae TaxID=2340725 RepID=UPI003328A53A
MAKLSDLRDFFAAPTLDAVWNSVTGSPVLDTVRDRVQLPCTASYTVLGSLGPWTFTEDSLYARIIPAPVGAGTTQTIMRVYLDASNLAQLWVDGGTLKATVINAGTTTTTAIGTYDAWTHAWWRMRESGGQVYFDTATDGVTWTNWATIAHTWSAAVPSVAFLCGYTGSEAAGMAAYVDHVSTLVSAPGQMNLAWPVMEDAWAPYWGANAGTTPRDRYVEITDRTRGSGSTSRGRQYETDQVRSGEASLLLDASDGALDPDNASGPWAGRIRPYQPYRKRAQWPPSRNLLDQVHATGGDLGGYALGAIPNAANVFTDTDTSRGSFVSSPTAWQGAVVMQFAVPVGTAVGARVVRTPRWSVVPGRTYTMQIRVRCVTASTSLQVQPAVGWYTANGGDVSAVTVGSISTLAGSTTAGWTTLVLTATAPATAAGMETSVVVAATAAAACSVQVDGWQLQKGSVATPFEVPGVWYPMYAGWLERLPSQWEMGGTYGLSEPTFVDTFSLLSQQQLSDPLTEEISGLAPRFAYRLDDPAGSTAAADFTGNCPPAPIGIGKYGAGSLVFGTEITAADPAGGIYTAGSGTVMTLDNSNPGTALISGGATFLRLTPAGIKGPADPLMWVRMVAFRYTGPTPTYRACMWSWMDSQRNSGGPSGSRVTVFLDTDGKPKMLISGPTNSGTIYTAGGATNCVDGNWHLLLFGYNSTTSQVVISQDGAGAAFYPSVPSTYAPTGTIIGDNFGGFVDATVGNGTNNNWKGDLAYACEFGSFVNSTTISNLYGAWKSACTGESTDARYARILRYAGYTGPTSIQAGLTRSMGPAANIDGQDAVSALQSVVETEGGAHYIDQNGAPTFRSRSARYNASTPTVTFGERADLGEWPYEDVALDYDPTHLANQVSVTQESTGQVFYASDAASISAYFPRPMSRTINSTSTDECQDGASYLLSRYRQPARRVESVRLHPSAIPGLWPVCLSLEMGRRVRIMRRPPGAPAVQVEAFVENINWEISEDNEATLTLQCSPADLTPYGVIAAWHTTLASATVAGATTITLSAGQDNTNVLAAQLAVGQQLVLGQNSANAETVTVAAVGSTSTGWLTGTVTLVAATTKAHSVGDTICEPLPAGTSDPTTWDASARFDQVAFAY